ncbi:NAD(+) synthase [Proteiniclasticum sp. BAD-10]|uniref:Glutamine-dependent NAD(+) synthetase n=1 Tax=Proteiniclasticum sediminis TaxID=2804028 RepID=A0A941HPW4_9CLOT|nr:NAD(+) synthase [Proteiniclasticum sediminis]MBR0574813.1 NAD(+) synthase [Proteiniclasticum sediminis]
MDFIKVSAVSPQLRVADVEFNTQEIIKIMKSQSEAKTKVVVFPELSLTGYTAQDLFLTEDLLRGAEKGLRKVQEASRELDLVVIVGLPLEHQNRLFNVAAVIFEGEILGIVPKTHIPNYNEFYESRWFTPYSPAWGNSVRVSHAGELPFGNLLFRTPEYTFGVEICEDLFAPISPSAHLSLQGAELIFNLSASNELVGKREYRRDLVKMASAKNMGAYIYASAGTGESTTDLVFSGHLLVAEYGTVLQENQRFALESDEVSAYVDLSRIRGERRRNSTFRGRTSGQEAGLVEFVHRAYDLSGFDRLVDPHPFVPRDDQERKLRAREILQIQSHGLVKRLRHLQMTKTVIGISGGLDSTLALLVIVKAYKILQLPLENIITVTMPGFGTTDRTYQNAIILCQELGTDLREISIVDAALLHFRDIGHDPSTHDATYENVQARERTQILMDIANKEGGIVVGTGDLSELALGWCTYNGDQMSMYGVNASVPKTLVRYLIRYFLEEEFTGRLAEALQDVLDTPVSPELLPKGDNDELLQKTEDLVGPYELHDFFLYHAVKYGADYRKILFLAEIAFQGVYPREVILRWLRVFIKRFYSQQFKRSAMPDGPKVGSISLSPRGDLRMPSDASAALYLAQLEEEFPSV